MLTEEKTRELRRLATRIRLETVKALGHLGFGHIGGTMSVAELLAVLYWEAMKVRPEDPQWPERDWLVCSKGHAGPAVYAALALRGYFPLTELLTINTPGTRFPSHCDRNLTIGVDMTTGSLGQGSSLAVGVALGLKIDDKPNNVYLILGDGEIQEGQVWEAIMFAGYRRLDNLIAFVDYNKQQLDGYTKDILDLGDVAGKFAAFGWQAFDVDGHSVAAIHRAVTEAKQTAGRPSVVVLNTVKGKDCVFAEGKKANHHVVISREDVEAAVSCLEKKLEELS
ncbi:MAG: transketolase [Negativicutes bacterium]|nr:transketolase [Negativicutes bacterium]